MPTGRRVLASVEANTSGTVILIVLAGVIAVIVCCTLVCILCYSRGWSSDRSITSPDKEEFDLKRASSKGLSQSASSPSGSVRVPPPADMEPMDDIMSPAWPGMANEEDIYVPPPSTDYGLMSKPRGVGAPPGSGVQRSQPFAPRVRQPLWPTHLSTIHSVGTVTVTQSEVDFQNTQCSKSLTLPDTPRASQGDQHPVFNA